MKFFLKFILLTIICMATLINQSVADFKRGARAYAQKDYKTAFKEFTLTTKKDPTNFMAIHNLGIIYYYGLGRIKDYEKAYQWYKKSADLGFADSQAALGIMYEGGEGVTQDYNMALMWYQKASDQNFKGAKGWVRRVKKILKIETCKPWIELANPFQQAQLHLFASQLRVSLSEKKRLLTVLGTIPWSNEVEVFAIGIPLQVEIGKGAPSSKDRNILIGFLKTIKEVPHCE